MNNTTKQTKKHIPARYFNELKNSGHTVPRDEKTGDVLPFKVGKNYTIINPDTKEEITARCTQDCPFHLKLIEPVIFETGATTHAVNELILFTDTTSELSELKDNIYKQVIHKQSCPNDIFLNLLIASQERYNKEFPKRSRHIVYMSKSEELEYCNLYASGFNNWKSEHGYK